MTCPRCGLPDNYRGQGDGIGSCDCPRCECCWAAPDDCECRRDWDGHYDDDPDGPFDSLCNDTACVHRQHRIDQRAAMSAKLQEAAGG